jgi:hypothetical protein
MTKMMMYLYGNFGAADLSKRLTTDRTFKKMSHKLYTIYSQRNSRPLLKVNGLHRGSALAL